MVIGACIALLTYGLATVDQSREICRPRAHPVAIGGSVARLRRADGLQNVLPLAATIVLAAGLGLVETSTLSHTTDQHFAIASRRSHALRCRDRRSGPRLRCHDAARPRVHPSRDLREE